MTDMRNAPIQSGPINYQFMGRTNKNRNGRTQSPAQTRQLVRKCTWKKGPTQNTFVTSRPWKGKGCNGKLITADKS